MKRDIVTTLRTQAQMFRQIGNPAQADILVRAADEIKTLRMADDLHQQGAEEMREEMAKVKADLAAMKAAALPVSKWWHKERSVAEPPYQAGHVVLGTDGQECVGVEELDALARLVREE